jgi:hypothetical protein
MTSTTSSPKPSQPYNDSTSIRKSEMRTDTTVSSQEEYEDAEKNYNLKSMKFWLIIGSVYLSFFIVAMDRMIIATAIPAMTNAFASIEDIGWYGSGYMLTCSIFFPLFGKIYQLYDTKTTFLSSIVVFEGGSALCGAAPSSTACKLSHGETKGTC